MYTEPAAVYGIPCIVEECWRSQEISRNLKQKKKGTDGPPEDTDKNVRDCG